MCVGEEGKGGGPDGQREGDRKEEEKEDGANYHGLQRFVTHTSFKNH